MKRSYRRNMRAGFTLVEILIVVAIIGVLLAVAIPEFVRARQRAYATSCQHNLMQILGAKERWAMDNGRGSTDTPTMDDLVGVNAYIRNTPVCSGNGTYSINPLNELPTCSIGGVQGDYFAHVLP